MCLVQIHPFTKIEKVGILNSLKYQYLIHFFGICHKFLKNSRYLWLHNPSDLSDKKKILLEDLKTKNVVLAKTYEMKENLRDLYNQEMKALSEVYLDAWCELVESSGIQTPMIETSKTLRRYRNGILSYIENKITSGVVEGLNSIIQSIKTMARWYPNIANFKTMIYLKLGDFPILSRVGAT